MYLIFPVYEKIYGMSIDSIIAMGTTTNPYVTNMFTFMCFSLFPFNVVKYGVVSTITFVAYKKLSVVLKNVIS